VESRRVMRMYQWATSNFWSVSGQQVWNYPAVRWAWKYRTVSIDYRCDNRRFWLSAHSCQVQTPTSQNLELEQQIRIFGAD
jgi:hypothetical protein